MLPASRIVQSARRHGADAFQRDLLGNGVKPLVDDPAIGSLVVAMVAVPTDSGGEARHAIRRSWRAANATIYAIFAAGSTLPPELGADARAAQHPIPALTRSGGAGDGAGLPLWRRAGGCRRRVRETRRAPPLPARGTLAEYQGKAWLAAAGSRTGGWLAADLAEARRAARIGYPVALKAQAARLTHKSDAGGLILHIGDDAALAAGWKQAPRNIARWRKPD